MTPFSTDRVSLGRPAICGEPGAMLGQDSCVSTQLAGTLANPNCMAVGFSLSALDRGRGMRGRDGRVDRTCLLDSLLLLDALPMLSSVGVFVPVASASPLSDIAFGVPKSHQPSYLPTLSLSRPWGLA